MFLTVAAVLVAFAALNRLWGMDVKEGSFLAKHHHKAVFAMAALVTAALYHYTQRWEVAPVMAGWLLMRSIPYKKFGGSLAPSTANQLWGSLFRFLVPLPFFMFAASSMSGLIDFYVAAVFVTVAIACVAVSRLYAAHIESLKKQGFREGRWPNTLAELAHGALYGIAVVYTFSIGIP